MNESREIRAYEVGVSEDMPIVCASVQREWMDASDKRFAYRCLPLVMANQAGWLIQNPINFAACWNGGPRQIDLQLRIDEDVQQPHPLGASQCHDGARQSPPDARISSHFGGGVLTFKLPYLFRTPPGINLWVKGPSNWVKDGVFPLEGIVESDWSTATFTMNWKLTRPGLTVRFKHGEPICMIVPVPRGLAESLKPLQLPINAHTETEAAYKSWYTSRQQFLRELITQNPETVKRGWQKDYFHGHDSLGSNFAGHQTQIPLKDFVKQSS